jgi:RNA polymerase sigma-70 factor, ECF subfamily
MADDELKLLEERMRAALVEERYQQAYELLATAYYAMVFRHCCHMLSGEKPRAEDATQRVFAEVGQGLRKFRGEASVKNWLLAIAHKVCLATLDKDRRRRSIVERHRGSIANQVHLPPPQGVHVERHTDEQQQLAEALTKLPPEKRSLVVMRFGIGLPHEATIADLMQITGRSRASVHRDLKEALEQLKRTMTHVVCG